LAKRKGGPLCWNIGGLRIWIDEQKSAKQFKRRGAESASLGVMRMYAEDAEEAEEAEKARFFQKLVGMMEDKVASRK